MEWQPIETAPKDKDILVFVSDGEYSQVDIANWQEYYPDGFNWAAARCVDGLHLGGTVTNWMPLPEPPKDTQP